MNTISLRLYPETETLYKRLLDECDAGTNGKPATADQFINYLLECAQNPRKIEVRKAEDLQQIETLTNKVLQLEALQTEIEELRANNGQLQTAVAQSGVILPGNILFQVTEEELKTLEAIKPYLIKAGYEGTNEEALYAGIKKNYIIRK